MLQFALAAAVATLLLIGAVVIVKSVSGVALATGLLTTIVSWSVTLAIGLLAAVAALALSLVTASVILDRVEARLKNPAKSYTSFVGLFVGLCTFALSQVLRDDKILNALIAAVVAAAAAGASECLKHWPRVGLAMYLAILAGTALVIALSTSEAEFRSWMDSRTLRDWVLMISTGAIVLGLPLSIWLIERARRPRPPRITRV